MRRPEVAIEIACFRIAQEALTNVMKHAGADTVLVALMMEDDALDLLVEADGAVVGGTVRCASSPLGGTLVRARLRTTSRAGTS